MNLSLFLLSLAWLFAISSAEIIYGWKRADTDWKAYPAGGDHILPIPENLTPDNYTKYYLARAQIEYNGKKNWHIGKYNSDAGHFTALLDDEYIWSTSDKTSFYMFHHEWTVFSWIKKDKAHTMKEFPNYGAKIPGCEELAQICRTLRTKTFSKGSPSDGDKFVGVVPGYVREGRCHYEWRGVRFHEDDYEVIRINQMGFKRREFLK